MNIKSLIKNFYRKRFSVARLSFIALTLVLLDSALLYVGFHSVSSSTPMVNYTVCTQHNGQALSYDGAIQFEACLDSKDGLSLQYSAQNLPRIDSHTVTTKLNHVVYATTDPADLVSFLQHDYEGCDTGRVSGNGAIGYYKILKVVPDRFALLDYGCNSDPGALAGQYSIVAMKLGSGWALLSPTNNMNERGIPSCLLVDMFRISKSLSSQCYQNTGYNDGSLRQVSYL